MLLSIDPEKIKEQLATPPTYAVMSGHLETQKSAPYEPLSVHVYNTTTAMPVDMERARARLLLLRQRLIDRGIKALSGEELERTIDDTRG